MTSLGGVIKVMPRSANTPEIYYIMQTFLFPCGRPSTARGKTPIDGTGKTYYEFGKVKFSVSMPTFVLRGFYDIALMK